MNNILVQLDYSPRSSGRFELALRLAEQHQASLTALFATSDPFFSQGLKKQDLRAACEVCIADAGVKFNWLDADETQADLPLIKRISQQAIYNDLLIVGQPEDNSRAPRDLVDQVIMTSGCPTLTIPYIGNFKSIGQRVMIAWKAGRSSARALRTSIPLIKQAQDVILLGVVNSPAEWNEAKQSQKSAIESLQCNGINARAELLMSGDIDYGDVILNCVAERGIDLLIAGAASPSFPSRIAAHLLKQMTVPILMSS